MRIRLLLISFLFVCSSLNYLVAQRYGTGLILDDNSYAKVQKASQRFKFSDDDLPTFSLKQYCPKPESQGQIGSCTGWATGYAALTIAEAIQKNITNTSLITANARSAMYMYLQIVKSCPKGSSIHEALELAKSKGVCLQKEFDNGKATCNTFIPSSLDQISKNFTVKNFYRLFDLDVSDEEKISATRNSIRAKKPVIIGMWFKPSLWSVGYIGHWSPSSAERIDSTKAHAMTVIGYDDEARRFELINSWGTNWGKDGFFTISYDDYADLCMYGYQFALNNPTPTPTIKLQGNFDIKKQVGKTSLFQSESVTYSNGIYNLSGMHVGDFIRLEATRMLKDKYVYIFSIKPNREVESLFPETVSFFSPRNNRLAWSVKEVPIVQADEMMLEFPENKKEGFVADIEGEDYMCILYSSKEITDYGSLLIKIAADTSSDVWTKLSNALGNRLINKNEIQYSSKSMGFTVSTSSGYVAPIILRSNIQPER